MQGCDHNQLLWDDRSYTFLQNQSLFQKIDSWFWLWPDMDHVEWGWKWLPSTKITVVVASADASSVAVDDAGAIAAAPGVGVSFKAVSVEEGSCELILVIASGSSARPSSRLQR